jgi:hypothetical protein
VKDKECLHSHRIKLLGGRRMGSILCFHLSFPDHMHEFDTTQQNACTPEGSGANIRFGQYVSYKYGYLID